MTKEILRMAIKRRFLGVVMGTALSAFSAVAGVVESESFSVGFGFSDSPDAANCWNMTETGEANLFPKDLFVLEVAVTGGGLSGMGPTFIGRSLQECSGSGKSGMVSDFQVEIKVRYIGPRAVRGLLASRYCVRVEVKEISIYAAAMSGATAPHDPQIQFEEITPDRPRSQRAQTVLTQEAGLQLRENFIPIVWKVDTTSSLFKPGTTIRTFRLKESAPMAFALDGLEIKGRVIIEDARN